MLMVARFNMAGVSSGSSSYSFGSIRCASTRARSDFKERRDTVLFAFIGFPHAKNVAISAARGVTDNDDSTFQGSKTDDVTFAVVFPGVFNLDRNSSKHNYGIFKIKTSFQQRKVTLSAVKRDFQVVIVYTTTKCCNKSCIGFR